MTRFFKKLKKVGKTFPVFLLVIYSVSLFSSAKLWGENKKKNTENYRWQSPYSQQLFLAKYLEAKDLIRKQKWKEAKAQLEICLKEVPDHFPARLDMINVEIRLGNRESALKSLQTLIVNQGRKKVQRDSLIARMNTLSELFLTDESLMTYEEGLSSFYNGKLELALEKFLQVEEREPFNLKAGLKISQCRLLKGQYKDSLTKLTDLRELNPFSAQTRLWLGRALFKTGKTEESIREMKQARQRLKTSELAPIWLAEAYLKKGDRGSATDLLEKDLKEQPYHLLSLVKLARIQLETGKVKVLVKDQTNKDRTRKKELWSARKNLQLALSRFDQYREIMSNRYKSEIAMVPFSEEKVKGEILTLLQEVESEISLFDKSAGFSS